MSLPLKKLLSGTLPANAGRLGAAVRTRRSQITGGQAENLASCTASSATQCKSNPVSGRGLPKTGIFQISVGDYWLFRSENAQNRSPETDGQFAKARHWRAFVRVSGTVSPSAGLVGWGGRIRTSVWWNQNPLPYHLATPQKLSGNRRDWRPSGFPFGPAGL